MADGPVPRANLHNTAGLPPQGLWITTNRTLTPDRAAWSQARHEYRTDDPGTSARIAWGTYGPSILPPTDHDDLVMYTGGVRAAPKWPRRVTQRILRGRLTTPAPFSLSVATIEFANNP